MSRTALGLDYGTASVRALVVDCETGAELAEAVYEYPHKTITESLPGSNQKLPPEFALQCPADYTEGALSVIREVLKKVNGEEANRVNALAHERGEKFLEYYSGIVSSEWMLPKCWETLEKAPEVYEAADLFIEAGDWIVQQMTGSLSRNACAAGYKGLWSEELGNPSEEFLTALDPALAGFNSKLVDRIVGAGIEAGTISEAYAAQSGLKAGTPVSAAIIDAHSGVPGMGVSEAGPLCMIMGTSACHMLPATDLHLFDGYAGVVKDGILPGLYGYESGQSAVGDIFGWFAKDFMGLPFDEITAKAQALKPGETGLVALDWMNGNRSILMDAELSGLIVGLTLSTKPEEVYRALVEATAFGTKIIIDSYRDNDVPITEIVACGGLIESELIMQIYADVTGLPIKAAASGQAVALGSAIFGAVAAGSARGGFDSVSEAIPKMTQPFTHTFEPNAEAAATYSELFSLYKRCHDRFGVEEPDIMKKLRRIKAESGTKI